MGTQRDHGRSSVPPEDRQEEDEQVQGQGPHAQHWLWLQQEDSPHAAKRLQEVRHQQREGPRAAEVAHSVSRKTREAILERAKVLDINVTNAAARMRTEENEQTLSRKLDKGTIKYIGQV